ncbi:hypothetical protein FBU30_007464 [Linnemannia zychae]|nr:hypothetical protein FBU30_007464 [Linnemannia zychae]
MSTPTAPIPAFRHPCLGPGWNPLTLYLIGNPDMGNLTVYAINLSNITSPTATFLSRFPNSNRPLPTSMKCNFFPQDTAQNSPIMVESFQVATPVIPVYPNSTFGTPWQWNQINFLSARTYSIVGAAGDQAAMLGWANIKKTVPGSPVGAPLVETQQWAFVRQNWVTGDISNAVANISPTQPMLSAGVYFSNSLNGALIVFDQQSNGVIYQTTATSEQYTFGKPFNVLWSITSQQQVDLDGAVISSDAIPVDAQDAAYILDKTMDGLTAVYVIRPKISNKLEKLSKIGEAPPFTRNMTAMAWKGPSNLIVTYYLNTTTNIPYFNLFSPVLGTWTGLGLASPPPPPSTTTPVATPSLNPSSVAVATESTAPIGGIVGGVIGGLVVIALVSFVFIRRRKSQPIFGKPKNSAAAEKDQDLNPNMKKSYNDESDGYSASVEDQAQLTSDHIIDKSHASNYDDNSKGANSIELRESKMEYPQSLGSNVYWDDNTKSISTIPSMPTTPKTPSTLFTGTDISHPYTPPTIPVIFQPQQGYFSPRAIIVPDSKYQYTPPQSPQFIDPSQQQQPGSPLSESQTMRWGGSKTNGPQAIIPEAHVGQYSQSTPEVSQLNGTVVPVPRFYDPSISHTYSVPVGFTAPNAGAATFLYYDPLTSHSQSMPVNFSSPQS